MFFIFFCLDLAGEILEISGFSVPSQLKRGQFIRAKRLIFPRKAQASPTKVSASSDDNGSPPKSFDYDLIIIGAGVGGHGAAMHAVEKVPNINSMRFFFFGFKMSDFMCFCAFAYSFSVV